MQPLWVAAGAPADQLRQTIDQVMLILQDPQLKGESQKNKRREKLREVIHARFDFAEMAKHALGSHWRQRSPAEQEEFVKLFRDLLEQAYFDEIESYNGEKVQYVRERVDGNFAEVDTKIIDNRGREFSVNYRLHNVNGQWKVYDVVIENVSLVNNYRSQFNRVLSKSSFEELLATMKEKNLSARGTKG